MRAFGTQPGSGGGNPGNGREPLGAGGRILAGALALLLTFGTAWASRVSVSFSPEDEARLRLSWRMDGVVVKGCRVLTPEELAELPEHMRNPEACIGRLAPYLLRVEADGELLASDTLRPHGARGDRPIIVLRDLHLVPGRHRVDVAVTALLPEDAPPPEEGTRSLRWSGDVELGSRAVGLLTLDATGEALELRLPGSAAPPEAGATPGG